MWSANGSTSYVCVSLGCPAGGLCLAESHTRVCMYLMTFYSPLLNQLTERIANEA
jgi:hypothetical protein